MVVLQPEDFLVIIFGRLGDVGESSVGMANGLTALIRVPYLRWFFGDMEPVCCFYNCLTILKLRNYSSLEVF